MPDHASTGRVADVATETAISAYRAQVERFLCFAVQRSGVPGLSVNVVANGYSFGASSGRTQIDVAPISTDSRFEIGSVAKLFASLVALDLVDRGRLDLSAKVSDYLPELGSSGVGQVVTLEHLLTETGGFASRSLRDPSIRQSYSWERLVRDVGDAEVLFQPGLVHSACPISRALLAEVVVRTSGFSLGSAVQHLLAETVSKPEGSFDGQPSKHDAALHVLDPRMRMAREISPVPLGDFWRSSVPSVWLSTSDLAAALRGLMLARAGTRVVSINRKSATLIQQRFVSLPRAGSELGENAAPVAVSYGGYRYSRDWLGLDGATSGQYLSFRYHTAQDFAVVVGATANAPPVCGRVMRELLKSLGGEMTEASPATGEVDSSCNFEVDAIEGEYVGLQGGRVTIRRQNEGVLSCEVQPVASDKSFPVTIEKDSRGYWSTAPNPGALRITAFREPASADAALMIGLEAHKKCSAISPRALRS